MRAVAFIAIAFGLVCATTARAEPLLHAHVAVSAAGAVHADSLSAFGLDDAATDGFDAGIDLFAPPTPPGDWVVAYFDRPAWGQIWNRFMTDLRSPLTANAAAKQWPLTVSSNIAADITIRLAQTTIPAGYSVRLLDTGAGNTELVADFANNAYTYASPGGTHEFLVEVQCVGCVTGIDPDPVTPRRFALLPNYPNPFNAATTVRFTLAQPGHVNLRVYNLLGQPVAMLVDRFMAAGEYRITWQASDTPSGVYFIRLAMGNESSVVRAVLLK